MGGLPLGIRGLHAVQQAAVPGTPRRVHLIHDLLRPRGAPAPFSAPRRLTGLTSSATASPQEFFNGEVNGLCNQAVSAISP